MGPETLRRKQPPSPAIKLTRIKNTGVKPPRLIVQAHVARSLGVSSVVPEITDVRQPRKHSKGMTVQCVAVFAVPKTAHS